MANQRNYVTDIISTGNQYTKFTVSRIVDNPLNSLIQLEMPTNIPEKFNVEINLYSLYDNLLVYSTTLSSDSEIFNLQTFTYSDGSYRQLLFFDFSKTDVNVIDGRFQVVFSFIVPVIGDGNVFPLMVKDISPSRTELQLQLMPEYKTTVSASQLTEFVSPQISTEWVDDVMRQVFNQPSISTVTIPTDNTTMSYQIVESFLPTSTIELLNNEFTNPEFTSSVKQVTQLVLDAAYDYAVDAISNLPSDTTYTLVRLNSIVSESIVHGINSITEPQYGNNFTLI